MKIILVVDNVADWNFPIDKVQVVASTEYIVGNDYLENKIKVFNLCKSYKYQTSGYYVSLLAQARGHKVLPSTNTILEMNSPQVVRIRSEDLDELIQKSLSDIKSSSFVLSIYFGKNLAQKHEKLALEVHKVFNAPLVRAKFIYSDKWRLTSVGPISLQDVPPSHMDSIQELGVQYLSKRVIKQRIKHARFELAILVNPDEKFAPSNAKALKNFIKASEQLQINAELITKQDSHRIAEYDGLFIRETTSVNHYTFRLAQKAEALGLAVIDDPTSILRCSNKVYLAELFRHHHIPSPQSFLVHKDNLKQMLNIVPMPCVLKLPDSSFSLGVVKCSDHKDFEKRLSVMFEKSEVIVVQEFIPTAFDWRVGVLNQEILFVCKYYMARNHWQIYNQGSDGGFQDGEAETIDIHNAPKGLLKIAIKATSLVGQGLYGVDIKEIKGKFYVIEINDNPTMDAGGEDKILKDQLYLKIMSEFLQRMEKLSKGKPL